MADSRRCFYTLALVALIAGLTAPASAQQALECTATATVPTVLAEGNAELLGDIVIDCVPGVPTSLDRVVTQVNLAASARALSAQATSVAATVQTTGMVGIGDAQAAQLNLLNPGVEPPAIEGVCTAAVSFVDADGNVLQSRTLSVVPGKSTAFILGSDIGPRRLAGDRREIRAIVAIPAIPPPPAADASPTALACHLIPTLEILDTVSGRTLVVLEHVETIPSVTKVNR